jgi:hypothetical protein
VFLYQIKPDQAVSDYNKQNTRPIVNVTAVKLTVKGSNDL